ncbi:MAG TPA: Gfo/Idh/MocA family oxidoreductase [Candidatus Hydrogenedentes bacterium]|nr:Gfo/Idh/MocA family oxidoreductase [Candidatus Hydrogenedentota bacterium]HPG65925.1 Gfo/Idh/MocA family oxidoreductase [Candidatus Hydrogenedentota bacterium]
MMNRRDFLKAAVASAPLIISARALGLDGSGANEQVKVGLIGLGGRCRHIAGNSLNIPSLRVVAVCDCFKPRVDAFLADTGKDKGWNGYTDFREMIEKEKLDAVMVETTTHARAWVTCWAMASGVDVYIEKPMCLTIAEGRAMVNAARKFKRVTQVGTQQRTIALNTWASDLVKNGAIGPVKVVRAPNFISPDRWVPQDAEEMPDGGSENWWDIWTNQTELRPYRQELHYGWARWWDYDGGGISFGVTGWGTHSYDQIQRGLGTDTTGPVEVVLEEPVSVIRAGNFTDRQPSEDETGAPYYHMVRNTIGPRAKVSMKYANGTELHLDMDADCSPGLGCVFEGEKGIIEINRDRISANPKELIQSPDMPGHLEVEETQAHVENWIECIKSRGTCTADIEYGQRSSTICYLVNIARDLGRVGESLKWDPDAERFTNCDEGNAMLARPRRAGYELPA